jgi:hypothetical protein
MLGLLPFCAQGAQSNNSQAQRDESCILVSFTQKNITKGTTPRKSDQTDSKSQMTTEDSKTYRGTNLKLHHEMRVLRLEQLLNCEKNHTGTFYFNQKNMDVSFSVGQVTIFLLT